MLLLAAAIVVVFVVLAYGFTWLLCRSSARADEEAQALIDARPPVVVEEPPAAQRAV